MPSAARLEVRGKDKSKLRSWVRASGIRAGLAQRARIVLLAGEGLSNTEIATRVGVSRPTVIHWRDRYAEGGLAALADRKRSGRRRRVDEAQVVAATLNPPPERLGVTHWSSRLLGGELGIGFATVARIWRKWNLQPWRVETFKFSTDPEVQALQRTAPILPIMPGVPEKATHDYIRNGTTTLFAALEVATGKVVDACQPRHRHQEFLRFLKQVAKAYPRRQLHIVCDNYATHKHPRVKAWLACNPRITLHFTPTSGSWLNLVEIFFGIITRQAIRRGSFDSVRELVDAIRRFIAAWNERCEPFIWTKDADTILAKAKRKTTSDTRH